MKNLEVIRTYYPITPTFKGYDGTLRLKVTDVYSVFHIDGEYMVCLTKNLTKRNPKPLSISMDVDSAVEFANWLDDVLQKRN
jgi:hypothetical protein